jgi:hypothetical protein
MKTDLIAITQVLTLVATEGSCIAGVLICVYLRKSAAKVLFFESFRIGSPSTSERYRHEEKVATD